MAPRDDETYRHLRRKNEPDWAPKDRPERHRDDKRKRRQTAAPPIKQRFNSAMDCAAAAGNIFRSRR
jgi:hypothetical protein